MGKVILGLWEVLPTEESAMHAYAGHHELKLIGLKKKRSISISLSLYIYLPARQKRLSDPILDGCKLPCGCWVLNSGPLEKQDSAINC